MATASNAASSKEEAINAKSMGLICDGKTDNAAAFEAIHAKTASAPGQTVFFPPASLPCLSSQPLVAASGTTYTAEPGAVVLKASPGNIASPMLFQASGVTDVLVRGLSFNGGLSSVTKENNAIAVFQSTRVVFEQVTVTDVAGIGITFSTEISESGIRNSQMINVGNRWKSSGQRADQHQGVAFCCTMGNKRNFVIGSRFDDIGLDAVSFSDQTDFLVSGNHFTNVGGGIRGKLGAGLNSEVANRGLAGGAAIYGAGSVGVKVTNNVTDGAGGNGIDLYRVSHAEITGNTSQRSGGNGIAFAAASHATISGNVVLDNNQARLAHVSAPQSGIFLTGGRNGEPAVSDVTISKNIVADDQTVGSQNYGVQLQEGSTSSNIHVDQSNQFHGNVRGAFGEGLAGYRPAEAN